MAADATYSVVVDDIWSRLKGILISATSKPTETQVTGLIEDAAEEATRLINRLISGWDPASANEDSLAYTYGARYTRAWACYEVAKSKYGINDRTRSFREDAEAVAVKMESDLAVFGSQMPTAQGNQARFSTSSTYTRSEADTDSLSPGRKFFDTSGL